MDSDSDDCVVEIFADALSNKSENDSSSSDYDSDSSNGIIRIRHDRLEESDFSDSDSDSDSTSQDDNTVSWSTTDNPPIVEAFLGDSGVKIYPNNSKNVIEVIDLFIGDNILLFMVYESNRYYRQNSDKFKDLNKSTKWKDITLKEFKKFLGLILLMGVLRKPSIHDYWSTDPLWETPFFLQVMSRDRFCQIWKSWHFSNNEEQTATSGRLSKIQPIIDHFIPKFNATYKPTQELFLAEAVIKWKGGLTFHINNDKERNKYGISVKMVCDSTIGYISNLEIYTGERKSLLESDFILRPYFELWHHIYIDNLCNSVNTSETLLERKIRICGTISKKKELPSILKAINLKKGESAFCRRNDVLIQIWKPKEDIRMISTIHSAQFELSFYYIPTFSGAKKRTISMPSCIVEYNKCVKGIEPAEEYLASYSIMKKTKKWTKKVALFLIYCALLNSYIVYKKINKKKLKYSSFLKRIAVHWANVQDKDAASTGEAH